MRPETLNQREFKDTKPIIVKFLNLLFQECTLNHTLNLHLRNISVSVKTCIYMNVKIKTEESNLCSIKDI